MFPKLGEILAPKIGEAIEGVANGAANIISRVKADPTAVVQADVELEKLKLEAKAAAGNHIAAMESQYTEQQRIVNQQMAVEAQSEHWIVYSWRPLIGYVFCLVLVNNYVVMPYFKNKGLLPVEIPDSVFTAILVILGAASAGRGLMKWQREKSKK